MNPQILLIHDDPDLFSHLHKLMEKQSIGLIGFRPRGANKPPGRSFALVAVDSIFDGLPLLKGFSNSTPVLIASTDKLKQSLSSWADLFVRKGGDSKNGRDPILEDFVEKKLLDFIRKARGNSGRNLYTLLVQEFEKPLITLTLKETRGNQIRASQLLGVNRNTLRKKIRELKITVVREKTRA
jgi:DNA-binding protein Fis